MVDYNALKKKFPTKDPQKKKKIAAIKAIKREYEAKRAALGGGAPNFNSHSRRKNGNVVVKSQRTIHPRSSRSETFSAHGERSGMRM